MPFVPRREQQAIFHAIYRQQLRRLVVLKARRIGFSTGFGVLGSDIAAFNAGAQVSIIDQTQDDAAKKLDSICKVALEPIVEHSGITVNKDNESILQISVDGDATSAIHAGKNARGGTNQFLHVSEWQPIFAEDKRRSERILTGALPTAEHGIVAVETTWMLGKVGHLWDIVDSAIKVPSNKKSPEDWRVFFFPWWVDPTYQHAQAPEDQPAEIERYLDDLASEIRAKTKGKVELTHEQRNWYHRQRATLKDFIFREFPSRFSECFQAPSDDIIVSQEVMQSCLFDYKIDRLHVERDQVASLFGEYSKQTAQARERRIEQYIRNVFGQTINTPAKNRIGFDVAASGTGDLTSIYIDQAQGDVLQLRALFTCRTEDWHFTSTVLQTFMRHLSDVTACGDETGLGRQICWEMGKMFPGQFHPVNFRSEKQNMGMRLMNQLACSEKHIPIDQPDIASDYLAMRKVWTGSRWAFVESPNPLNSASHCDIAWSGALASMAAELGSTSYSILLV